MKRLLATLLGVASLLSPLAAMPVQAAAVYSYPSTQSLIKSNSSASLYWYSSNGRRYVFPTLNTYYSWFSSDLFSQVTTLSDSAIAAIPFAGNVTYRPGAKMVKIQTDPRVYVVARYGTLRWITSESLAQQIYGWNWASQVQDVPDAFFTNYTIGAPIYTTSDYNVSNEYNGVTNPDDSLSNGTSPAYQNPVYPPVSPISGSLSAMLSLTSVNVGQTSNFYVRLNNPGTPASNLRIALFEQGVGTLKTCYQTYTCDVNVYGQSGNATRNFYAKVYNERGESLDSNSVSLTQNGSSSYYNTPGTSLAVGFSRSEAHVGESFTVTATVQPQSSNPPYYRITIMDQWGSVLRTCDSVRACSVDTTISSTADTRRSYSARAVSTSDSQILDSGIASIVIAGNTSRSFNGYSLGVTSSLSSGSAGQVVSIAAGITPSPYDLSNTSLDIWNQTTGELVRRCYNANYCQASTNLPSNTQSVRYYAVLTDTNGTVYLTGYSPYITIGTTSFGNASIATDQTTYSSGQTIYVTSNVQGYSASINNLQMEIYSDRDGLIQTCVGTTTCNITRPAYANSGVSTTDRFSVRVRDYVLNQYLPTAYSNTITIYSSYVY